MVDDGKRPRPQWVGDDWKIENNDGDHIMLEILDAHPCLKPFIEKLEREAFRAGYRAATPNHTEEFSDRASLLAYARWIAAL